VPWVRAPDSARLAPTSRSSVLREMAFRDDIFGVWLLVLVVSELHFWPGVIAVPSLRVREYEPHPKS
jgi:hypothetical protein